MSARAQDVPATATAPAGAWHVYIVANKGGALYTGITTDLTRRLDEHRSSRRGARFFRFAAAARLLYSEPHDSRSSASRREAAIKQMSRAGKLALIAAMRDAGAALPHDTGAAVRRDAGAAEP